MAESCRQLRSSVVALGRAFIIERERAGARESKSCESVLRNNFHRLAKDRGRVRVNHGLGLFRGCMRRTDEPHGNQRGCKRDRSIGLSHFPLRGPVIILRQTPSGKTEDQAPSFRGPLRHPTVFEVAQGGRGSVGDRLDCWRAEEEDDDDHGVGELSFNAMEGGRGPT